jgi:hypothetical protein
MASSACRSWVVYWGGSALIQRIRSLTVTDPPVNRTRVLFDRRASSGDSSAARMDAGASFTTSSFLLWARLSMYIESSRTPALATKYWRMRGRASARAGRLRMW